MSWVDILIVLGLLAAIFWGIKDGLIRTLFGFAGIVLGIFLAGQFAGSLGDRLGFISDAGAAHVVAFAIILLATIIVASILGLILSKLIHKTPVGWLDHLLGGVVGFFLGAFFIAALLAMWTKWIGPADAITGSALGRLLLDKIPFVLSLLPGDYSSIQSFFN